MHTKYKTTEEFLATFNFQKPSYEEFCERLRIVKYTSKDGSDSETLDDYVSRNPSRGRVERIDKYRRGLYRLLVEEPEVALSVWWDRYGSMDHDMSFYFNFPDNPILNDKIFNGMVNAKYGRICRAVNFDKAYNTKRTNIGDHERRTIIEEFKMMFERYTVFYGLPTPAFYDIVCGFDKTGYKDFWQILMSFLNKPSILNPYTYREILDELFDGKTLFAPCMSWNSCQVAFYNTHFDHFISTDVIPSVVDNGRTIHQDWVDWNNDRAILFPDEKTVDLYLCPSEQLQKRYNFIEKYHNKVDAILFCPPYFDLELYDSPEQSVDSFPDYLDWLKGYWEETVKMCVEVMRPGARFGFIISNYYHDCGKTLVPISNDMELVVNKHLHLVDNYKVQWSRLVNGKRTAKQKDGNFEDLWLFEKR